MDEVFETLQVFHYQLEQFNEKLFDSFADLNKYHEKLAPHWHDNMRLQYDIRWRQLEDGMKQYVLEDGSNYTDLLKYKLNILRQYLYGG